MTRKLFVVLCIGLFATTAMAVRVQSDGAAGLVAMEAELYDAVVPADTNEFEWVFDTEIDGYSRAGYMRSVPGGTNLGSDVTRSPRLDYDVEITQPGMQYIWGRVFAPNSSENSFHLGVNGQVIADRINVPEGWVWLTVADNGQPAVVEVNEPGMITVNCWMRESGICIDKLLLTTDPNYVPTDLGPRDSMLSSILAIEPNVTLEATGVEGTIESIDGVSVNDLILGVTTFAGEPRWPDYVPANADNFVLSSRASADEQAYMDVMFDLPVTKLYIVEIGTGDAGMIVPLDGMGRPMDGPTPFTANSFGVFPYVYKAYGNLMPALMIVTPEVPIRGIRILPPEGGVLEIDPASISGIAGSILSVKPINSLDYLSAADLDPDNGDPSELIEVLAINGIPVEELVLGTTTADFEKFSGQPAAAADNFILAPTYASLDDSTMIETAFQVPVTSIFIMERGANDTALIQPIDLNGNPIGAPVLFVAKDTQFQNTGLKIAGQKAGGMLITSDRPISGIVITPAPGKNMGIDPASISAFPIALITKAALETLVADVNAVATEIHGYAVADLILGSTIAADDLNRADNADNFDLSEQDIGRAGGRWITTTFMQPVTQFFVMEMTGSDGAADDDGWVIPLDIDGKRLGSALWYYPADWSTFDIPGARSGRPVAGLVFTPTTDMAVYGLLHWSDGVDVLQISAVPASGQ